MKNNEAYNNKQRNGRIRRATKLLRRYKNGETVNDLAVELKVTPARIYKLIASVR